MGAQCQCRGLRRGWDPIPAFCPDPSPEVPVAGGGCAQIPGLLKSWGSSGEGGPGRRGGHEMQLASLTGMS